ncbi:MAG TPA: FtsW/RodA/SpoVE family cell cycle protein, partial [Clostridia bacterium]|nr:FtsW/RodA/SpoVE family cell cycle protein [Clostridia bacterium]
GGFFGLGIGNSRQKYLFLPFAESDFILSIIAEETGFVGCLILLGLFVALIVHGIRTAARASTRFECYLAAGVTAMLAVQSAANVAVVSGAIPPTGLPLPFISAGGTSLIAYMCAVGLIMNVRRNAQNTQKLPPP